MHWEPMDQCDRFPSFPSLPQNRQYLPITVPEKEGTKMEIKLEPGVRINQCPRCASRWRQGEGSPFSQQERRSRSLSHPTPTPTPRILANPPEHTVSLSEVNIPSESGGQTGDRVTLDSDHPFIQALADAILKRLLFCL
ncbi:uncharacterized protein LOC117178073 [Belonocnema kinseyi]|uniref:uncharacterized protein LOC117178073 n=1 Tax=Belonocnema kinseyi TaxID=2817044 RepID=UPI00143D91B4|nr:uncharacterized protein LOC117178073 [Belonocnema kinseyi]